MPTDLTPDPEENSSDSSDFTEAEALSAIETTSRAHFIKGLEEILRDVGGTVQRYELKRRDKRLYCRVLLGVPDKAIVFRVDWLGASS